MVSKDLTCTGTGQLSTLFNDKLQQLPAGILQKVRKHSQDRDHGELRNVFYAVEDLQLLQDLMPGLRSEEVGTQVHRAVNGRAREGCPAVTKMRRP